MNSLFFYGNAQTDPIIKLFEALADEVASSDNHCSRYRYVESNTIVIVHWNFS